MDAVKFLSLKDGGFVLLSKKMASLSDLVRTLAPNEEGDGGGDASDETVMVEATTATLKLVEEFLMSVASRDEDEGRSEAVGTKRRRHSDACNDDCDRQPLFFKKVCCFRSSCSYYIFFLNAFHFMFSH